MSRLIQVVESDGVTKKSLGFFNTLEEAKEFVDKCVIPYKDKGYYTSSTRYNYGKYKNYLYSIALRRRKSEYISWTIVVIPEKEIIALNYVSDKLFGRLYNGKRTLTKTFKFSEKEVELLEKLANKYKTDITTLIRVSLINTFKELKNASSKN